MKVYVVMCNDEELEYSYIHCIYAKKEDAELCVSIRNKDACCYEFYSYKEEELL